MTTDELITILSRPVPDQADVLVRTRGMRDYPLLMVGRSNDPLVSLERYGIAGQSYYSRPNSVDEVGLKDVPQTIFVRQSIAERLADINFELQYNKAVEKIFGRKVELYVDDGLRSLKLQQDLHDKLIPESLRKRHPKLSEKEILTWRDRLLAYPPKDTHDSPSPHMTGGAVDLKLRYVREDQGYVPGSFVAMGTRSVQEMDAAAPDYYEHKSKMSAAEVNVRRNRRAFYWIMRGALLGRSSGFVCNPTEWWHWSYGDQLWAAHTQAPYAFYGTAKPPKSSI
ncbi:MAG TPA: M15 family metallopeptidase [Bacillota bacterium]|nr:M15 family metallopeptidase [Bacillota bacterium]